MRQAPSGVSLSFAVVDAIVTPEAKLLLTYWLAKRGDRFAPPRAEFEPRDIRALLPSIHLYDVADDGRSFSVRVVGTRIVAAIGADPTGQVLTADAIAPMYARTFALLAATYHHRRPLRSSTDRTAAPNRNFLAAESVSLPLSDDNATINKVMMCTIFTTPRELL